MGLLKIIIQEVDEAPWCYKWMVYIPWMGSLRTILRRYRAPYTTDGDESIYVHNLPIYSSTQGENVNSEKAVQAVSPSVDESPD